MSEFPIQPITTTAILPLGSIVPYVGPIDNNVLSGEFSEVEFDENHKPRAEKRVYFAWQRCDGAAITNPRSPLAGQFTPNLANWSYLLGAKTPTEVATSFGVDWERDRGTTGSSAGYNGFGAPGYEKEGDHVMDHTHHVPRPRSLGVHFIMRIA